MRLTEQHFKVAAKLVESIRNMSEADIEEIRDNIRRENEAASEEERIQKPTRQQMEKEFDL